MTTLDFKNWMIEYMKSERFDAKVVIEKLKLVHYSPTLSSYKLTRNASVAGYKPYEQKTATFGGEIKYIHK